MTLIFKKHHHYLCAFTLTEIAIVIGIIGLILAAIWVAASAAYANLKVSKAATETLAIVQNFKSLYGGNRNGQAPNGTDLTSLAISSGLIPTDMLQTGNTSYAIGPWDNSQVNVLSASNSNAITVGFWNIDQPTCNRLADAIATGSVFPANGLVWTGINGTHRTLPPYGTDAPFSLMDVQAACAAGNGSGLNVQVTYSVN